MGSQKESKHGREASHKTHITRSGVGQMPQDTASANHLCRIQVGIIEGENVIGGKKPPQTSCSHPAGRVWQSHPPTPARQVWAEQSPADGCSSNKSVLDILEVSDTILESSELRGQADVETCLWEGRYDHGRRRWDGVGRNAAGARQKTVLAGKQTLQKMRHPTTSNADVLQTIRERWLGLRSMCEAGRGALPAASIRARCRLDHVLTGERHVKLGVVSGTILSFTKVLATV